MHVYCQCGVKLAQSAEIDQYLLSVTIETLEMKIKIDGDNSNLQHYGIVLFSIGKCATFSKEWTAHHM